MPRPVGGGLEWQADPSLIRVATAEERLSVGVRAADDRSLTGVLTARPLVVAGPPPFRSTGVRVRGTGRAAQSVGDGSAETDADVLLDRHPRGERGGRRRLFRYVPYSITQVPSTQPEYEAR